jgi:hypothetical protein
LLLLSVGFDRDCAFTGGTRVISSCDVLFGVISGSTRALVLESPVMQHDSMRSHAPAR